MRSAFDRCVEWARKFDSDLSWSQRIYLSFAIFGSGYFIASSIASPDIASGVLVIFYGLGIAGAVVDFYRFGSWLLTSLLGKAFLSLLYFATTTAALGAAGKLVNETVRLDTVDLTFTRNIVAVLLVPTFAAVASLFLALMAVPAATIYGMLGMLLQSQGSKAWIPFGERRIPFATLLFRLVAMGVMVHCLEGEGINEFGLKEESIKKAASWFAYNLEAVRYTRCSLSPNQAAVKGEGGEYLVISENNGSFTFEQRVCR